MIELIPISQANARKWVNETHRHLSYPQGDLYRIALHVDGQLVGVGVAGRPARKLQDGRTVDILRIASIAEIELNACSRLYGAIRRAGLALGYQRFITYTLEHEPGTSLRAAGFMHDGTTPGGEWSVPSRLRAPVEQSGPKHRWIWPARASGLWDRKPVRTRISPSVIAVILK